MNWSELEEVLLDTEINLNRRLLTYVEDALQYPILTPNNMLPGRQTVKLDKYPDIDDIANRKRRQRFVARCKDAVWERWKSESLTSLRERHNMAHKAKEFKIIVGEVVMIKQRTENLEGWNHIGNISRRR